MKQWLCCLSIISASVGLFPDGSSAALLGVGLDNPILANYDLQVDYIAGGGATGTLTVDGPFRYDAFMGLQDYTTDGITSDTYLGSFYLTAEIDKSTKESVSGTLEVWSDTDLDGTLDLRRALSDQLLGFGFGGDGLFDFYFRGAGGSGDFLPASDGDYWVILDSNLAGLGEPTFLSDFSNGGDGKADLNGKSDIPEPATLGLLALGAAGMVARRRR